MSCGTRASSARNAAPRAVSGWRSRRSAIAIADVIRAVEGPLATRSRRATGGVALSRRLGESPRVWIAVRANLRKVVEHVTVADVAAGHLPKAIDALAEDPEAWVTR